MALNAMLAEAHWRGAPEAAAATGTRARSRRRSPPARRARAAPSSTRTPARSTRPTGSTARTRAASTPGGHGAATWPRAPARLDFADHARLPSSLCRRARRLRRGRRPRRVRRRRRGPPLGSFRAVFEAVAAGDAVGRRRADRERHQRHGPRELRPADRARPRRSAARSSCPVGLCLAALPGQRLDDIERVYSHIQALGQAEAFLRARPWQLLSTYNTAGAGKAIADARRARRRRRPLAAGRGAVRPRGPRRRHRRPARQPDPVPRPRPAGRGRPPALRRRSRAAGRRSSSRSATSRARCSRSCASSPSTASTCTSSSRGPAASAPGSTSSGSTSTRDASRPGDGGRARASSGASRRWSGSWAYLARGRLAAEDPDASTLSPALAQLVADLGQRGSPRQTGTGGRRLLDEQLRDQVDDQRHDDEHDQRRSRTGPSGSRLSWPRRLSSSRGRS